MNNESRLNNTKIHDGKPEDDANNSMNQDIFYLNSIGADLKSLGSDSDCPLSFPMVQQRLDEYNYKLQNQQNQLLYIQ